MSVVVSRAMPIAARRGRADHPKSNALSRVREHRTHARHTADRNRRSKKTATAFATWRMGKKHHARKFEHFERNHAHSSVTTDTYGSLDLQLLGLRWNQEAMLPNRNDHRVFEQIEHPLHTSNGTAACTKIQYHFLQILKRCRLCIVHHCAAGEEAACAIHDVKDSLRMA